MASEVGDDVGATSVGAWNPSSELWDTIGAFPWGGWDGDDFETPIGTPLLVSVDDAMNWPYAAAMRGTFNVKTK